MIRRLCDGCRRLIADDDRSAARDLPLPGNSERVDWCGDCVAIICAELPHLAARARAEARAALTAGVVEPVQQRALRIWDPTRAGA